MDPAQATGTQATGKPDEQLAVPVQRGSRVCIEGLQSAQAALMNGRTGIISADFSADQEERSAPAAAAQPASLGSYGAHGKHVVSAVTLILAASYPVPLNFSLPAPQPMYLRCCARSQR